MPLGYTTAGFGTAGFGQAAGESATSMIALGGSA